MEQGWNSHQPSPHTKQAHIHTLTHTQRHAHPHTYTYTLPQIPTHPYTYTVIYIHSYIHIHICTYTYIHPCTHTHSKNPGHIPNSDAHCMCVCVWVCVCVCARTCVCVCAQLFSHVWLFATPWTMQPARLPSVHGIFQARILEWIAISSSRGSSLGDLPYPGIKPRSLAFPAVAGRFFTNCTTWEAPLICMILAKNVIHSSGSSQQV